ncbi:RluA family pseudouridine synthase [Deminuibacter soli]|uniref:RluA family pseudouridine synthase n=1 Tax=Deminuibacter soli TaxID=2291815 RepID=A0A3E1NEP2_9BACT|nr:RluA family pseudouridine synthase [Deminuibacter soli]RFM26455.1 RluA family pseudouridine synthase [Deminuibacter soli]
MEVNNQNKLTYFEEKVISETALPARFTFPFYYEPHPLTKIAAAELQHYLETQTELDHNFGLSADSSAGAIGKMFGVLVVQDMEGRVGYLSAFSGKLAGSNAHPQFVPPVFDMLVEDSFFLKEQEIINTINARIEAITTGENYLRLKCDIEQLSEQSLREIAVLKQHLNSNKEERKHRRDVLKRELDAQAYAIAEEQLIKQSLYDKHLLKELTGKWKQQLDELQATLAQLEAGIEALKNERRERSATLQQQLFEQYTFLNKAGKSKSLQEIFSVTAFGKPPAAAGECATPKLLQFAFANGYTPLAMAEFWWGAAPKSEIRQHKQFYPACTGKCKPILAHMLEGMPVDENPFLRTDKEAGALDIVYEDASFVVVNKPAGLRSVPGVDIADSVYSRLKHALPGIEPLIVHRLDMDTSGLLVIAKTPAAHKHIQKQFLQRTVSKRYVALLSKVIEQSEGQIELPLRADLFNRPRQLVCFNAGKKSITRWKVVKRNAAVTKVHFWPLTGRTHQLRMHAAHALGLNAPIVGDDLYGTPSERMYLHAAYLEFRHPQTKEKVSFEAAEGF